MIRFINRLTGSLMLVAPEREAEYLSAGHMLAEEPQETAQETAQETEQPPKAAPAPGKRPRKPAKQKEG